MNTNIAGSDATSAQTLRAAVHRLIVEEGKSDAEVLAFLQDRYGDFVLYDPPLNERTWLIWSVPLLLAGLIGLFIFRIARTHPVDSSDASLPDSEALASLDDATRDRLEGLLSRKP
jgi:cytochrome c-type biogenesis protein CcmH